MECLLCGKKKADEKVQEGKSGFCRDFQKHKKIISWRVKHLNQKIEVKRGCEKIFAEKWRCQRREDRKK